MALESNDTLLADDTGWHTLSPKDHVVQVYARDAALLDALEGFAASGLAAREAVIVIATPEHHDALEARLKARGVEVEDARKDDRFVPVSAADALASFMSGDWPEEQLFREAMAPIIARARAGGRKVRAFGEMVALLWSAGNEPAAVRLEYLWNKLLRAEQFPLFCAYPRAGFEGGHEISARMVCAAHTRVFSGD